MKNLVIAIALVLIAAAAVPAVAQNNTITVNVPFSFQVGQTLMPAGEYTVSKVGDNSVMLKSSVGKYNVIALTNTKIAKEVKDPNLGFRKFGARYILVQAWLRSSETGRSFMITGRDAEWQTASLVLIRPMGALVLGKK